MVLKTGPLLGGLALLFALNAQSAIVTQYGNNVSFTYDDSTLFGTGTVIGDSIFFTPTDFIAESLNGEGEVITSDMLDVQVQVTTQGYWFTDFAVFEQGDYQLVGDGASASVSGMLTVDSNTSAYSDSINFDPGPLTVQNTLTQWNANGLLSLSDTAGWTGDTDVDLSVWNESIAETLALGEEAFVQKKIGGVSIEASVVPVPAAVWLFGSGLMALFGWKSRRKPA